MFSISPKTYGKFIDIPQNQIYGEIAYTDFIMLIHEAPMVVNSVLDIGSGCGTILFHAAQDISSLDYLLGVENNRYRFDKSILLLEQQHESIQEKVEFICDDFQNISFSQTDMVYCCNTMFDTCQNKELIDKCLHECKGVFVLFTLEPRCLPYFLKTFWVTTSWINKVRVFMYAKL